jgi:hypothetical protein
MNNDQRTIATIACKLFAIFIVLQVTQIIPMWITTLRYSNQGSAQILNDVGAGLPFLVHIVFALFLWFKTDWFLGKMVGQPVESSPSTASSRSIEQVVYSIMGVYLLAMAIPGLGSAYAMRHIIPVEAQYPTMQQHTWQSGFQFVIGLILTIRPDWVSRTFQAARTAIGLEAKPVV